MLALFPPKKYSKPQSISVLIVTDFRKYKAEFLLNVGLLKKIGHMVYMILMSEFEVAG
jgi:hypothetical protein